MWTRTAWRRRADVDDHAMIAEGVGNPLTGAVRELLGGERPGHHQDETQQGKQAK